jgi:hypothetical protein
MTAADLLSEIENFLVHTHPKMAESTFGRLAVNDGKFVGRLRNGGGLTLTTAEKARAFIAAYTSSRNAARAA